MYVLYNIYIYMFLIYIWEHCIPEHAEPFLFYFHALWNGTTVQCTVGTLLECSLYMSCYGQISAAANHFHLEFNSPICGVGENKERTSSFLGRGKKQSVNIFNQGDDNNLLNFP